MKSARVMKTDHLSTCRTGGCFRKANIAIAMIGSFGLEVARTGAQARSLRE